MDFDIETTAAALVQAIKGASRSGWKKVSTLVTTQSRMMALQAAFITESTISGPLRDEPELRQLFIDQLADSVRGLARDVAAMTILTLEKAWNAAVAVLWGAMNKALGAAGLGGILVPGL